MWSVLIVLAISAPAPSPVPLTLDNAIYITSEVDRDEAWLGEAVTLTLEYWEINFRGVKVQPFYRSGGVTMPEVEGFYAGPVQVEHDDRTRDGALYAVTVYRQRLYPAVAGDLEIGPWHWKGSVRGYLASGNAAKEIDLSTPVRTVRIRPLPVPPSTFRGAVGEYGVSAEFATTEAVQGVPLALTVTVRGNGNPETLESPAVVASSWYTVRGPESVPQPDATAPDGVVTSQFRYELMPVEAGRFSFPALSLTYFSPENGTYQSVRTSPVPIRVAAAGPQESLVVMGGVSGADGAAVFGPDGRLALLPVPESIQVRRNGGGWWPWILVVPPVVFGLIALWRGGLPTGRPRGGRHRYGVQLRAAIASTAPADGVWALISEALSRHTELPPGPSAAEVRAALEPRVGAADAAVIASALQACQRARFGGANLAIPECDGLERALTALARREGGA